MIALVIFLIPFIIGILLIGSDAKVGPIPVKVLGWVLTIAFGFLTLLLVL